MEGMSPLQPHFDIQEQKMSEQNGGDDGNSQNSQPERPALIAENRNQQPVQLDYKNGNTGSSFMRMLFAILSAVTLFVILYNFLGFSFEKLGLPLFLKYNGWFSLITWVLLVLLWCKYFLVSVPEVCILVTVSYFDRDEAGLREYPTGLHVRFPWEQVKSGNYIDLRTITKDFPGSADAKAEGYADKDGVILNVKWSFQYKGKEGRIKTYIGVDKTTIDKGLHDIGGSFLSQIIVRLGAEDARKNIKLIERCMRAHYEIGGEPIDQNQGDVVKSLEAYVEKWEEWKNPNKASEKRLELEREISKNGTKVSFEEMYGIDIRLVSIADIDFEDKYQQALSTEQVAKKIDKIAQELMGKDSTLSRKDAIDKAMVLNKNLVKTITENIMTSKIEGVGGEAVANFIMSVAKASSGATEKPATT